MTMAGPRMSWPLVRLNTQDDPDQSRFYNDEKKDLDVEVTSISSRGDDSQVIGSSNMFDENGNIRLIPVSGLVQGLLLWTLSLIKSSSDAHSESER